VPNVFAYTNGPEMTCLLVALANSEQQIDTCLDMGDQRRFRLWCKKRDSLKRRVQTELLKIITAR